MKNKAIHDLVKQHHHDIRTCEENITNLSKDLTRLENVFNSLWKFVYENEGQLAPTPQKQEFECRECGKPSNKYQVEVDAYGYIIDTVCKDCLVAKDNTDE
jgi:hypothetical protein